MIKHLSIFILTSTALSLTAPSFAQTTLAELDAKQNVTETAEEVTSPIDYETYDILMERAAVDKGGRPRVAYDFLRDQEVDFVCLLYTSPSPRDRTRSRMPSSA